jgi:type I restriction enzyme S subunit
MEAISEFGAVDSSRTRPTAELAQGYSFMSDGDVAYAKVTPCFENGKGLRAAGLPGGHAFATTEITVMRPSRQLDSRYLAWILQSEEFRAPGEAHMSGAGGLRRVPESYAARYRVPHPSTDVQRRIADYLDHETAQIDAFIAKNEELITLLTERRAAVIVRSVSRGVRDGVALKPSGTEWATDVPSHWRVGNIRRFASMKTGHTPSRQHPEYWVDCDIPWFTLADVWQLRQGRRDMGETSEKISSLGLANSAAELLPAGTVALSRTASVGFAGIMPVAMATSQDFWNWVPRRELLSEYLWFQFQAMKPEFERLMTGSTHRTIYQADAASFTILVPPVSEQREIVERLDSITTHIDDAIATAHRGVALARERRAALISAAVTGKIDMGAAA